MKVLIGISMLVVSGFFLAPTLPEAPAVLNNKTNGLVDSAEHSSDYAKIEETDAFGYGLDPLCVSTR